MISSLKYKVKKPNFKFNSSAIKQSFSYKYDFFVIGGGSGGLAAAKEAANFNIKVGVADYVIPSQMGTKWGLGGTCVNVGCIPKKLYHAASMKIDELENYSHIGVDVKYDVNENKAKVDWNVLTSQIQTYIKKLNFGHKKALKDKNIDYYNKYAKFIDKNTISLIDNKGKEEIVTAEKFLISVGGRPNYGNFPGAKENCITSDDIFSLKHRPGRTLVVGGSYISLECAGFLNKLSSKEVNIMVRSRLLRGFDNDISNRIEEMMINRGIGILKNTIPIEFKRKNTNQVEVLYKDINSNKEVTDIYDNVLLAIGRNAVTEGMNLEKIGVKLNDKNKKLIVDQNEKTTVDNIFSIGDCADNRPELTPSAIKAGRMLVNRLYNNSEKILNYDSIPTTVFTPLEYGCVGLSEEDAMKKYKKINVFHSEFVPLEWTLNGFDNVDNCYLKVIVNEENDLVVGVHLLSPNAGEVIQGFAVAMNCGLTKEILSDSISIHPTIAEEVVLVKVDKKNGDGKKEDC